MDPASVMPFGDHLEELRKRLVLGLVGVLPIMVVCFVFGGPLLSFILVPLIEALGSAGEPTQLLATSPFETFAAYMKVAIVVGLLVGTPWIVLQAWLFVAPGLYERERRFVYFLIPLSAVLTAAGMTFLYKVLLPVSLYFLILFGTSIVEQHSPTADVPPGITLPSIPILEGDPRDTTLAPGDMWINEDAGELRVMLNDGRVAGMRLSGRGAIAQQYRVGEYVGLVFTLALIFAVAFQLPLVLLLLSWSGLLRPQDVTPYRRHVIFGCAVLGAVLTPQDPGSMVLLGSALYVLFEFGIVLMRFVPARVVAEGFRRSTDANEGDE